MMSDEHHFIMHRLDDGQLYAGRDVPSVRRFYGLEEKRRSAKSDPEAASRSSPTSPPSATASSPPSATASSPPSATASSPPSATASSPSSATASGPPSETACSSFQLDECNDDDFRWSESAVLLLISTMEHEEDTLTSVKSTLKKFWEMVANLLCKEGYQMTGGQCKSKWNGLKKTYKSIKDHNNKSGNSRSRPWKYFQRMDEVCAEKPWVAPLSTAQSSDGPELNGDRNRAASPTFPDGPPQKRAKSSKRQEEIVEMMKLNAEKRENMHQETLKRQDEFLSLTRRLVLKTHQPTE